ncbi:MAG TPA: STAS domain-containing protein [Gammaproteobacteria bacterium]|nr:STAS domain-containing protein [Gammaproteobacteria bacterium]
MTQGQLLRQSAGQFSLAGDLSFETVPQLVDVGAQLFQAEDQVCIDLAQVGRSDSAGLALLVSWLRLARQQGKRLYFRQVPAQLLGLARVSGVERILSLEPST